MFKVDLEGKKDGFQKAWASDLHWRIRYNRRKMENLEISKSLFSVKEGLMDKIKLNGTHA